MYTANLIRTLSERDDIDLTVLAIGDEESLQSAPTEPTWHLSQPPRGSGIVRGLIGRYPRSTAATISSEYKRKLETLLRGKAWDAILIDYIVIGWILDDVKSYASRYPTRIVYISHNVETTLRKKIADGYPGPAPLKWVAQRDAAKAARLEGDIVRAASLVTAETEEDVSEFRSLYGVERIHKYTPGYDGHVVQARQLQFKETDRAIAVIGSRIATMKRLVLDDLLRAIAVKLKEEGIRIVVAGDAPADYLASRARQYPFIDFHGYVADLPPLLATVRLGLITDHIGGGFKHRILTLVFNRVPIVATREVMAGLPLEPNVHYVEVAGNDDAADTIAKVIDDCERLENLQQNAFAACKKAFDWRSTTDSFVKALHATPLGTPPA
ncbi:glycosyltransferase [Mycolicibacterium phlei]